MNNSMNNILICSAGQRVSLVRAFQGELKLRFPSAEVYTTDMAPELSAACNVSDKFFKVKRVTDPDYINDLLALARANGIRMIVPTIDTELQLLASNKILFDEAGIKLIVSEKKFVDKCRDKRVINQFFLENDIEIPRTVDKHDPVFPLFIKPYDGSLSVDTFLIKTADELTDYHMRNEKFLFMEYIDRDSHDEFTVDMYYGRDNRVRCIIPRKRIWVRGGEVNKALASKNEIVHYLKQRLDYIEGAIGCLTLQVFMHRDNKRIVGIEINPRFGGGYPLSYHAGGNFPGWLIEEYFEGKDINYTENWEANLLMLRYDDEVLIHDYSA